MSKENVCKDIQVNKDNYENKKNYINKNNYIYKNNNGDLRESKGVKELKIGQCVVIRGSIKWFSINSNLGEFNEYKYYVKQLGYRYKVIAQSYKIIKENNSYLYTVKRVLHNLSRSMACKLELIFGSNSKGHAGLLKAMILGDKGLIDEDIKDKYTEAGITHILAISGLHITMLGMCIYRVLMRCKIDIYISSIVTMGIILLYGLMTHFSVSTNRAVVMMLFMLAAKFFSRSYDMLTSCCVSFIVILIQNPYMIENSGTQLSYLAVISIIYVNPILYGYISPQIEYIENNTKQYIVKATGQIDDYRVIIGVSDIINKIYKWVIKGIISGISILLLIVPVLLNSYYEIKSFSLAINLFVIPLVSLLIPMTIIGILISYIWLDMAIFTSGCVRNILDFYQMIGTFCQRLSIDNLVLGYTSISFNIMYYALIITMIVILKVNKKNKKRYLLCVVSGLSLLFIINNINIKGTMDITMLDVGQGECISIITPKGKVILVDCGSSDEKEIYKYKIKQFLKYKGEDVIDYVAISHMDSDHTSGVIEILKDSSNEIRIKNILVTNHMADNENYKIIKKLANKKKVNIIEFNKGDKINIDKIKIECLYPNGIELEKKGQNNVNNNLNSMVLYMTYKSFNMLFTGDIEDDGERYITKEIECRELDIDVLKVPHHGSKNSSSKEFVLATQPELALISAGENNSYGHPHKEIFKRYAIVGSYMCCTKEDGAINLRTDGKKLSYSMMVDKYNELLCK
ncbi:MAG: DNA internalization-related competence protein ComEC/Rec2 [Lachnospiraceae bacterium]|nr:DNA internalization-related competence protein ComEC/Rec2 [Lachnospiraceae bacterium]